MEFAPLRRQRVWPRPRGRHARLPASPSLSSASCCDDSSQAPPHPKAGTQDRAEFAWQLGKRRSAPAWRRYSAAVRRARQLGARSSFHEQRHIISDPTSVESRVHACHRRGDLVRREMRILAGQMCLDFGDGSLLADLGHRDSFQVAGAIVNPSLMVWSCSIHLATPQPPVRRCRGGGGRRHGSGARTATNPLRARRRDLRQAGDGRTEEPPDARTQ